MTRVRRTKVVSAVVSLMLVGAACAARAPQSLQRSTYSAPTALPAPQRVGGMSLDQALATRRSVRTFSARQLSASQLGQLLWAGQGITSQDGKRTAPSAGGLYPIELYAVVGNGLWHYLPVGHRVEIRAAPNLHADLQKAAFGQQAAGQAPQVIAVAVAYDRTTAKYGARGRAYVDMEAGHVAQNILLQAAALRLAAVPIGGIDQFRCATVLGLPPDETVAYLIPTGFPG